ncbi:hypothetical protein [Pedobacter africanus]|uniref:hypothetical protein n=1 Tax=Pedobacter africanus TaxID=151894 RepID=UPI0011807C4D|nr:hypothetical protein [Pedobacter africanus]
MGHLVLPYNKTLPAPVSGRTHLGLSSLRTEQGPKKVRRNTEEEAKQVKCNTRTTIVLQRNIKLA